MTASLSLSPNPRASASAASRPVPSTSSGHAMNNGTPGAGMDSTDILKGEKAVAIHHNGLTYRLQATRLGKLILTK
jgi:hemin uptake protein HemP